jgi:TonB family protein
MTVSVDGKITNESIQTSSGFPRLDEACLKGVHGQRMLPATEDGKPVEKTYRFRSSGSSRASSPPNERSVFLTITLYK